ncbi:Metalloendoproteinase 3-MMP, partial [Cucurbita argyrosperma subsp. sororia]
MRAFETWEANTHFTFSQSARVQTADILFSLEKETWGRGVPFLRYDLESVALHEIGHALGLAHSNIKDAVMWPHMNFGVQKTHLHDDDLNAIRAIYGP